MQRRHSAPGSRKRQVMEDPKATPPFQWPLPALSIRNKIVLPYLILTLIVAAVGTYVVTNLVAGSLEERLTNHLLEAGRVVSDAWVEKEEDHLRAGRVLAYTEGMAEALSAHDAEAVSRLGMPLLAGWKSECLIVVDTEGRLMLHALKQPDGTIVRLGEPENLSDLWLVRSVLDDGDPNGPPRRGIGLHPVDQRYYYFTAVPLGPDGQLVGVAIIGTSLDILLPLLKQTSLAHVTVYLDEGQGVKTAGSTFLLPTEEEEEKTLLSSVLDALAISPETYQQVLWSTGITVGKNVAVRGRMYRLAYGPIAIGNDRIGVFSVGLPMDFILSAGATSRNTYALLFTAAMVSVILIGYAIARQITGPLGRLVRTSQAVAEGDLEQRTGIKSRDEIGVLATAFDRMTERLAERTRALERLLRAYKESAGRMRSILASIGDGVILEDVDGNLIPLNKAAEELLEELAANFQFGPLRELSVTEEKELAADAESNPWLLESRRFEVGKKVISAHSAAVRTDEGEYLGTVIVLRDVTAEVEAERLKDAFIAHVSHELRTPLTAIKGYVTLLLRLGEEGLTEEQRRFLQTIDRHTDNLIGMINTLLDFSEIEAGERLWVQRRPCDLAPLVREIVDEWRPTMEEKRLRLRVEVADDLPIILADARRLRWAIINLVRNAQQYTPPEGEVSVRLFRQGDEVVLEVADTGVGIPSEVQQHLFSRFFRMMNQADDEVR
ncbi:MAG TPA: HAMP domain-containing protein, partial [Chloroflexi bacterium]|nr:HAMP domain-containing protein [Chloroflexota bacterium]